jgi:hypothetical protein
MFDFELQGVEYRIHVRQMVYVLYKKAKDMDEAPYWQEIFDMSECYNVLCTFALAMQTATCSTERLSDEAFKQIRELTGFNNYEKYTTHGVCEHKQFTYNGRNFRLTIERHPLGHEFLTLMDMETDKEVFGKDRLWIIARALLGEKDV